MAKQKLTYEDVMKLAETYGVSGNTFFESAADRYVGQVEMIDKIQKKIDEDGLMIEHTNVKGDTNVDVNPLTVQLPKYIDTANKTLALMLDIVKQLGKPADGGSVSFDCE